MRILNFAAHLAMLLLSTALLPIPRQRLPSNTRALSCNSAACYMLPVILQAGGTSNTLTLSDGTTLDLEKLRASQAGQNDGCCLSLPANTTVTSVGTSNTTYLSAAGDTKCNTKVVCPSQLPFAAAHVWVCGCKGGSCTRGC